MVGEQRACAVVYASAFAVNIALCVVLIPLFGVAGAAIAISGAMILEAALLLRRRASSASACTCSSGGRKAAQRHDARTRRADRAGARARRRCAAPRRGRPRRMEAARRAWPRSRDEWRDLVGRALEPNVFYDPAFALPAAPRVRRGCRRRAGVVEDRPRLIGLFPARIERRYGVMATLTGWTHPYAPFGVPLVDRDEADAAIVALPRSCRGRDEAAQAPDAAADRAPKVRSRRRCRACWCGVAARWNDFGAHARALLAPAASRKTISITRRREEAQGAAPPAPPAARARARSSSRSAREPDAIAAARSSDYLALEAAGWKGRAGSAAARHAAIRSVHAEAVTALAAEGRRAHRPADAGRPSARRDRSRCAAATPRGSGRSPTTRSSRAPRPACSSRSTSPKRSARRRRHRARRQLRHRRTIR